MTSLLRYIFCPFIAFNLLFSKNLAFGEMVMNSDGTSGSISFGPPSLNVEEESSLHMPAQLRCDGCRIIAHLLFEAFSKEEKIYRKGLSESQTIDVADKVCSLDFKEYGITQVNGVKRLKGPGLDTETAVGVTQAGGRWPWRLQSMCHDYLGEYGEDRIYDEFKLAKKEFSKFFSFFCQDNDSDLTYCRMQRSKKTDL